MRRSNQTELREKAPRSKDWNPATFFIVLSLLIGSNAMQLLALRNEFTAFSRRADAKIGLLKEVIERVQKGEDVDVKGLLGTGNPEKEKEWEEVIREVEEEDRLWQAKERRQQKRDAAKAAEGPGERNAEDKTAASNETLTENQHTDTADTPPDMRKGLPGFY
ncbi:MAG: hypothetical protein L6R40_004935 [Gallowayella cf. fulva]|nr:MAG: hypothetical protein L6R40_004935 [Xanthomendoza cf. fulva]